jgi:two-component system, sensor histidine kinase
MPDDTVTTSWKRSTDKVRTPGGASVHRSLAETSRTLRQTSHADSLGLESDAASSPSPKQGQPAAGAPTDHKAESIRQAARLAAWEDEGGAPSVMPRILIVDDDVNAADSLASLLQSGGYGDTRVAYTGAAALTVAGEFRPTVLLVDLDLPDMSGYDLARQLAQHPRLQNLRLIALTDSSEHPGRELARAAGIERYLSKPVGSAALDEVFN